MALRLTITTSAQDGSAASARATAAPTCPVPPMIKTRNAILGLFDYRPYATCHSAWAELANLQPFSATYKIALITVRFLWETLPRWRGRYFSMRLNCWH